MPMTSITVSATCCGSCTGTRRRARTSSGRSLSTPTPRSITRRWVISTCSSKTPLRTPAELALPSAPPLSSAPSPHRGASVQFADITQQAGIHFKHFNGAAGHRYLPETMGAGGAFLDYDGDGWLDMLLLNGKPLGGTGRRGDGGRGRGGKG